MSLTRQAKILSLTQQKAVLAYLTTTQHQERNKLMFLLSVQAGLRAKEVAGLTWSMVTDAEGVLSDAIRLENKASKGESGGVVWLSKQLRAAFNDYLAEGHETTGAVIRSAKGGAMSAQTVTNWFHLLYKKMGFEGCSSHSGRRTAITTWARKIHTVGGSIRDVQALARHKSLYMTQRYIEVSENACKKVVG